MAGDEGSVVRFEPADGLRGSLRPPADKSISHRAAMVAALCEGPVEITNYLDAADTSATLAAVRACGVEAVARRGGIVRIEGVGLRGLRPPAEALDVGNSGTTIRLMPGILAGQEGSFTLDGDASIRRRPMDRIVEPLRRMGVSIEARDGRFAPLTVSGGVVRPLRYEMPVASAQVKSAVLLAGLYADGPTTVTEPAVCRDHTEIMLAAAGAEVEKDGLRTAIHPPRSLRLERLEVPADFSSAAFLMAAASIIPGSEVRMTGVGVNPTRTGFMDILLRMGADITLENQRRLSGEPVADITVRSAELEGVSVGGSISGRAIDELPLLALVGACAHGRTEVGGAAELRVKESDRIAGLAGNLARLGVAIEAHPDGFAVKGGSGVIGGEFDAAGDHRMAMLGAVAGLASRGGVDVSGFEAVSVSYPGFDEAVARLVEGGQKWS